MYVVFQKVVEPFPLSLSSSPQCNLWVSGLAMSVRALDLQTLFSRYGQVIHVCVGYDCFELNCKSFL